MHEGLNSLKPYSYQETRFNGEVSYQFTTTDGTEYNCYFLDASGYFESYPVIARNVVRFGFRTAKPTPFSRPLHDIRIRDTIFDILHKSTSQFPERSIFVMFDTRDRKSRHRKIIFSRWFTAFCKIYGLCITRLSLSIPSEDVTATVNVCMFVPPNSPDLATIKNAFIDIRDELISKGHPPSTDYQCTE
jgi:hypothetical protein